MSKRKKKMKSFKIYAGLAGGFGGAEYIETIDCKDQNEAENYAYEQACDIYESYDGLHGLRTVDDIMEEDGVDASEAGEIWREEREGWLDYYVEEEK